MTGVTELAAYGRWTRAERYGDVWYPNVPAGWVPYRNGYWSWVEPWGWTWVDDEAWGFAPFHYGRWLEIDDRWAWIPADEGIGEAVIPVYAPALVTFFAAGDACGWVPLGPQEVFVPTFPVSLGFFHALNAAAVRNIGSLRSATTQRTSLDRYVNRHAVTAVPRSAMTGSQPVAKAARPELASHLAGARAALHAPPLRPTAATAGVSPSVARRLGIAQGPVGVPAGHAQAHAPGPPISTVHPTPTARLAPPRALAVPGHNAAPQHGPSQPALAPPAATHHLPGSPVGPGAAAPPGSIAPSARAPEFRPGREGPERTPGAAPARPGPPTAPPAVARTPQRNRRPGACTSSGSCSPAPDATGRVADAAQACCAPRYAARAGASCASATGSGRCTASCSAARDGAQAVTTTRDPCSTTSCPAAGNGASAVTTPGGPCSAASGNRRPRPSGCGATRRPARAGGAAPPVRASAVSCGLSAS